MIIIRIFSEKKETGERSNQSNRPMEEIHAHHGWFRSNQKKQGDCYIVDKPQQFSEIKAF